MRIRIAHLPAYFFGGLQDCCLQFPDTPYDTLRRAVVEGALAALGIDK
jgi:hypothetical protein